MKQPLEIHRYPISLESIHTYSIGTLQCSGYMVHLCVCGAGGGGGGGGGARGQNLELL